MIWGRDGADTQRVIARGGDIAEGGKLVVLIDRGSAAMSEIVAGALQDHQRAAVIGARSFGKGTVQTIIPLPSQGALRLTTARYYTPRGRSIHGQGIEPDVAVDQAAPAIPADTAADRMLQTALARLQPDRAPVPRALPMPGGDGIGRYWRCPLGLAACL